MRRKTLQSVLLEKLPLGLDILLRRLWIHHQWKEFLHMMPLPEKKFSYIQDAWKLVPGFAGGFGMSVGALTAAVGLGKAAYHGVMAGVASHRASVAGHSQAAKKAKEHLDGMRTMFENTRYSDMVEKRFGGKA